ncbi:MAG: amidohydrolase family protein [Halobacteriales archaeon]|nr:amidohydrolase family protein [Halobacteriales archaeon]
MPSPPDTLLVGGVVVTVDPERRVLDPGAVAVADDEIVAVEDRETMLERYPDAERIDLEDTILMPGLVDSHGHGGHSMTKNLAGGTGRWMEVVEDVYFRGSDTAFWRADSYLAALEHLEFGVTTSLAFPGSMPRVDHPKYAEAAVEGFDELGLRHVINLGPPNPPFPLECRDLDNDETIHLDMELAFETTETVIERLDGAADGRLSVSIGPSSLVPEVTRNGQDQITGLVASRELGDEQLGDASDLSIHQLERVVELRDTHDVPVQPHAYRGQIQAAADAVPAILTPALSLAHCAGIAEREIDLLAENGVHVTHGPLTHAYAIARFPLIEALEAGVNVVISTDGAAPDRSFDLLSQGRVAAQLQRAYFNDISLLPAGKIIEMMTIEAARSIRMDGTIGSLEPGKKADVIAVDLETAPMQPRYQLLQRLVHFASGHDVTFTMVDGEPLLRNGELVDETVDPADIYHHANEEAMTAIDRVDATDHTDPHPNTWGSVRY